MDAVIVTGAFALGGVVVGGTINAATNYLLERRRERLNVRSVARLLRLELARARADMDHALALERWGEDYDVTQWCAYQAKLAATLTSEWATVSVVYTSLELFNADRAWRRAEQARLDLKCAADPSFEPGWDPSMTRMTSNIRC